MNLLQELASAGFPAHSHQRLSGGMIGEVYSVQLKSGEKVVAKTGNADGRADGRAAGAHVQLDIEGYMLRYLAEHSDLPVPQVLYDSPHLLVMSYIEGHSQLGQAEQAHAAEVVAALHNITAERSGMERDTVIAQLHQPNPYTDSWVEFFRDQRLLYMARVAHEAGMLRADLYLRVQKFAEKLETWLIEPQAASLLHGDLWTTNILAKEGRIRAFVDPAVYYGHAEIELAFSTLFGTFGKPFFERYQQIRPLEPDFFEIRRDIYNLYPLLVHVRLFGGGYGQSVHHTLQRFGF